MDKISKGLSDSIKETNLSDVGKEVANLSEDYLEIPIDSLLENGVVKEIPIIRTILSVPKIWKGITDYLLIKKVLRFLFQLKDIPQKQREAFIESLEEKDQRRIIDQLVLVLDKHEQYEKSEIQGRLFGALIKGDINKDEYFSLTYATSLIDTVKLEKLINFYKDVEEGKSPEMPTELIYNFAFLQLVEIDNSKIGTLGGSGPVYKKNNLGRKFISIITR